MPNGKTHDKITIYSTIPLIIVGFIFFKNDLINLFILLMGYLFSSFMFNGDLDINSKPYNRWWILKMIWIPYQIMFKHRSIFTHGIIIGTVIRIVYILPIFILITSLLSININYLELIQNLNFIVFLIGLEIGNSIHTLSDKMF